MQSVKILSDSVCDLPQSIKEKYNIGVIPLKVILGDDIYDDGIDVTISDIYAWADRTGLTPKTAAPSLENIERAFRNELENYDEIVCFSISASMSASNSNMHLAARELGAEDRIFVIDSASLSSGQGMLAIEAAEMAMNGADGASIADRIEKLKPFMNATFVVDTLEYLYRGGRCTGVTALLGSTLHLHPKIYVEDGEMKVGKKYRGNIDKVIMNYSHDLEKEILAADNKRAFIVHSGVDKRVEQAVYDYLASLGHFREIDIANTGGTVACHCGPGTLGVMFINNVPDWSK